jgi:hypothetical protein
LPLLERERLLLGNWKIRPAAGLYFKREWCTVVYEVPADLDVVRYWDLAATEKSALNDPDWTVGVKLGRDRGAVIGCWMWCAFEPTRAMSKGYCSILPHKTEPRSASGFARIRVKPAKARRFIWAGCSLASPWRRPSRAVIRSRGLGHSVRSPGSTECAQ